jgi:hypothetical protein
MPIHEFEMPTFEDSVPMGPEEEFVHLPVNKEIADALDVDGRAEVKFSGIVKEIDAGFGGSDDHYSIRIAVKRVSVEPENEFTDLSQDDDD